MYAYLCLTAAYYRRFPLLESGVFICQKGDGVDDILQRSTYGM